MEEEASLAMEKLDEITGKWENIQDSNDPLDLYQDMKDQKSKCLELIEQKNELIKDFQVELKLADERFMKDRKKMYEDVAMLTKRIDEQVLVMKRGYRTELQMIEVSVYYCLIYHFLNLFFLPLFSGSCGYNKNADSRKTPKGMAMSL